MWDFLLIEGDLGLFRVAIATLQLFGKTAEPMEDSQVLSRLNKVEDGQQLFCQIAKVQLSRKKFKQLVTRCTSNESSS